MTDSPSDATGNITGAWARILADIAHDVRGAAGATDMWLELLARARDDAERDRANAELRRSVTRSVRLAEDLGDAGALLEDAPAAPALPLDLAGVIAGARQRLEPEARSRRILLEFSLPDDFAHPIVGDAGAWARTVDRSIAAALAHAPGGVPFEVRVVPAGNPAGGLELVMACGELRLPHDVPLLAAWGQKRPSGASFPLGLFLARAFLERAGGRLELRDGTGGRQLVAVMP